MNGVTPAPALSVVIICFTSVAHLRRALDALVLQQPHAAIEIVVPHDDALKDITPLTTAYPTVGFIRVGTRATPAALRARGTQASRAPLVGFLEDHCVPAPDWVTRTLAAHQQPHAAVGGTIEKGFHEGASTDTALNWAIYLTDYSRYMPPMPAGPAHGMSDCNVSYKRSALDRIADVWALEFHENLVNGALAAAGASHWFDPAIMVFEQRDLTLSDALGDRHSFGRLFGSSRVRQTPLAKRLLLGAAALVMTPLLVWRVAGNLVSRRRHLGQLVRCLPLLVVVAGTWMVGESVGYVTGTAGRLAHSGD